MPILNFNMGRSYFFGKMTREIKFLDNKPDFRGMYPAKITNLLNGVVSLRPVKMLGGRFDRGITIEIH